ncbi:two-component system response regulator [Nitrincola tibetensis]|uniref:Two-component system response regulator n=1 Tax=Nitrincola tibetensis TaxID=2219697 RepID=A0A364NRS0_9GAMM|nr:response regulator [Nitrincola tibetensis]RAU19791.1 two-component system response regulator [Nitrincola tibetensis]
MRTLSASQLNVLLAEPSAVQRKIITQQLTDEGVTSIDGVRSIKDALASISSIRPDLIISALHFSDGNADDLLEALRADPSWIDIPFMLISSETRHEQLDTFKQSGVIAILPKPFTREGIRSAINATLDLLSTSELDLQCYDPETLKVLVVDDSKMARKMITRVLKNLGIENITQAEDGAAAIEILHDETFDLIVTDYNMPEINGLQLAEYIRDNALLTHIPVLMVTSEASHTHLSNVAQSGVNAMLDKPFEPELVKKLLNRLLE